MMHDLPFDVVELAPCPAPPPVRTGTTLREVAFRANGWLPDEIATLRTRFAADDDVRAIASALDRPLSGVQSKVAELGLRRNSLRAWTEMEDAYLAQTYGASATSTIAADLGRSPGAIYARAGLLGLTEGNPPYSEWELAQIRAGYAQGVPVAQLAVLIGRPTSGLATVASRLGLHHAKAPADWSADEQHRVLALAEEGWPYRDIAPRLATEGSPVRTAVAVGQALRKLGYGRGWGRTWLDEEDALLRLAYATGGSLTPLQQRLGRSQHSIRWRAGELKLRGTHARPNGWRTEPDWSEEEIAILTRDYGRMPTPALARRLGRTKGAVFNKAFSLELVHGYGRQFSVDEDRAIALARDHGVSLTDLSHALGRDVAVVSKHAIRLGLPFSTRPVRAPRGPRRNRPAWTLADILALGGAPPAPDVETALPDRAGAGEASPRAAVPHVSRDNAVPVLLGGTTLRAPAWLLAAMADAGLLRARACLGIAQE